MQRMTTYTIGFLCVFGCGKRVATEPSVSPVIEQPTIEEDTGVLDISSTIEPVESLSKQESVKKIPSTGLDPTVMQIKMGLGSDMVTSVNVTCDEFRTRKSIQNKAVTISNIPSNPSQCRLKFSPGGAVYILKNYEGYVLECTVINGNQATCK